MNDKEITSLQFLIMLLVVLHEKNITYPEKHDIWHKVFWRLARKEPDGLACLKSLRFDADSPIMYSRDLADNFSILRTVMTLQVLMPSERDMMAPEDARFYREKMSWEFDGAHEHLKRAVEIFQEEIAAA